MTAPITENIRNLAKNAVAGSEFAAVRSVPAAEEAGRQARIQQEAAALSLAGVQEAEKIATFSGKSDHLISVAGSRDAMKAVREMIGNAESLNVSQGITGKIANAAKGLMRI